MKYYNELFYFMSAVPQALPGFVNLVFEVGLGCMFKKSFFSFICDHFSGLLLNDPNVVFVCDSYCASLYEEGDRICKDKSKCLLYSKGWLIEQMNGPHRSILQTSFENPTSSVLWNSIKVETF